MILAREVGFPLVVRPSYVLGGRAMEVVFNEEDLRVYMTDAVKVSNDSPVLLDRFLDLAIEVDVDAICDGDDVLIGGIMEHIEQAGVHSGDSGLLAAPERPERRSPARVEGADPEAGQSAQRRRPDEYSVCNPERRHLHPRSEPASLANRAVCLQGNGSAARQGCGARDGRAQAQGARHHWRSRRRGTSRSRRPSSRSPSSPKPIRSLDQK